MHPYSDKECEIVWLSEAQTSCSKPTLLLLLQASKREIPTIIMRARETGELQHTQEKEAPLYKANNLNHREN
jgi:hypothetical protein